MTGLHKPNLLLRTFTVALAAVILLAAVGPGFSAPAQAAPAAVVCTTTHVVKANETLSSIAKKYNVTVDALANANGLKTTATVYKGQKLCIPPSNKTEATAVLSVLASKGRLTISGSGLAKSKSYAVKVREGDLGIWYTLGRMTSTKDGTLVGKSYTLPKDLRSRTYLTVCLKNQTTDQLTCRKVFHIP